MNVQHFQTFLWLRWRIRINQMRRGGVGNYVLQVLIGLLVGLAVIGLLSGSLILGLVGMPLALKRPAVVMFVWDGVVGMFLFLWLIGLMMELQRTDPLTLDRLLHLPVSVWGAFLVNYLSSLVNLVLILSLAAMLGLALGMVISCGVIYLLLFPLLAAMIFAVTAVTYQFQGWLASLMSNPRRRRTIIVVVTGAFVILAQLPNMLNIMAARGSQTSEIDAEYLRKVEIIRADSTAGKISGEEVTRQLNALNEETAKLRSEKWEKSYSQMQGIVWVVNVVVPPGWVPLGAIYLVEGNILPAVLAIGGLTFIGTISLHRAYRTTIRIYTGQYTSVARAPEVVATSTVTEKPKGVPFLERVVPGLSEQASAVALGTLTSFLRAPEMKMLMLTPIIFAILFGTLAFSIPSPPPVEYRSMIAFGAVALILMMMMQVGGNQFGFDRAGFRVYVLSPVPRRSILLGKNVALAPLPLSWGLLYLVLVEVIYPMKLSHLLALALQMVSMYLLFCVLANTLSILAPLPVAAGGFKASQVRLVPVLMNLLALFLYPMVFGLLLLPLGIELALAEWYDMNLPINLPGSVIMTVMVWGLYVLALRGQGYMLEVREQEILKVVTARE